jgi:uncharacterized protein YxjI
MEQPSFKVPNTLSTSDRFARDKFLLNQKVLSLGNKYFIYDENNQPLFFVDRPVFKLQAHVGIYEDETRQRKLLTLFQDSAWTVINHSFTVQDENFQPIAHIKRQGWFSMLRRTWKVFDTKGNEIAQAHEDSWWKAIVRRVTDLGTLLRTNFIITRPDGTEIGQFIRRFTLLDKYVMDLTSDSKRTLDRRIAVGLAILLDTAESR